MTFRQLFPPRLRDENVALIRAVLNAADEASFRSADAALVRSLHPSLFAELDWMEESMPAAVRAKGAEIADGMFLTHLPELVRLRRAEFALDDDELAAEVDNNRHFYTVVAGWNDVMEAFGPELSARIRDRLAAPSPAAGDLIADWREQERPRVQRVLNDLRDSAWLTTLSYVEVTNAMMLALDHLSSRFAATELLRASDRKIPWERPATVGSAEDIERMVRSLREAAGRAAGFGLFRVAGTWQALGDVVAGIDPARLGEFWGERAAGCGPCGTCAMRYASSAVVSLDPTCPGIFDDEHRSIYLALDWNITQCPFCGTRSRVETPAMFYSPRLNLVIYNAPRLGRYTESQARERCRGFLAGLRARYMDRVGPAAAAAFEEAREEFTYAMPVFIRSIQLGTTARVRHFFSIDRLADGSRLLSDQTNRVTIELAPGDLDAWSFVQNDFPVVGVDDTEGASDPSRAGDRPTGTAMRPAMDAFAAHDYDRARRVLEALLAAHPDDEAVRRNLAVLHVTIGDKQAAREVLHGARR